MRKRSILSAALVGVLLVCIAGCGKYDSGPGISLRSKVNRLKGNWIRTSITINSDPLLNPSELAIEFEKEGNFNSLSTDNLDTIDATNGSWRFVNDKESLEITAVSQVVAPGDTSIAVWDIQRLTKEELWIEYRQNGAFYELRFFKRD